MNRRDLLVGLGATASAMGLTKTPEPKYKVSLGELEEKWLDNVQSYLIADMTVREAPVEYGYFTSKYYSICYWYKIERAEGKASMVWFKQSHDIKTLDFISV